MDKSVSVGLAISDVTIEAKYPVDKSVSVGRGVERFSFRNLKKLNKHTGDKPYQCHICDIHTIQENPHGGEKNISMS